MSAPPGLAPATEPGVEHINTASTTELATRKQQMRFLVAHLGVTRPQAAALIRAYELDLRDARHRDAREFVRLEFGGWLQSNWHVGIKGWAVKGKVGDRA